LKFPFSLAVTSVSMQIVPNRIGINSFDAISSSPFLWLLKSAYDHEIQSLKSAINVQNTWESTKNLSPVSLYEHELMYSLDYVLAFPDRKRNSSSNSKWKFPISWVILIYGRKLFCRECTSGRTVQLLFHSCKRLLKKNIAVPNRWKDLNLHINISQSHACTPCRVTSACLANYNFLWL
jgi:hypothetical protein